MSQLKIKPERRKPKTVGALKLGHLRKYDDWALGKFIKRLNFFGLPYGVYVEGAWITSPNGRSTRLHVHVRIGTKDVEDRRKNVQIGGSTKFLRLPRGGYVSESILLNHIKREIVNSMEHELLESFHVDGHKVFDPHCRTGRRRLQ